MVFDSRMTATLLESINFAFNGTITFSTSYGFGFLNDAKSATRSGCKGNNDQSWIEIPPEAGAGEEGAVSIVVTGISGAKVSNGATRNGLIRILSGGAGGDIYLIPVTNNSPTSAIKLYVDSVLKGTGTTIVNFEGSNYIEMRYKATTTTWNGELALNHVVDIAEVTETASASLGAASVRVGGNINANIGVSQIILFANYTDTYTAPDFVTLTEVTGDNSSSGTWPRTGGELTDWETLELWDLAKFLSNASPASTEHVTLDAETPATATGITPIPKTVTVHVGTDNNDALEAKLVIIAATTTGNSSSSDYHTATAACTGATDNIDLGCVVS